MPMLQDMKTNEIRKLGSKEEGGLPLVIDEDWPYEKCEFEIPPNSRLLLYTDGLDEALSPDEATEEQQFGEKGIIRTLKESVGVPIEEALERLFQASHEATGGMGRHDDTSVVLLERSE
jgi:serine phosphatase RsbU (regulator of sigma subunit)